MNTKPAPPTVILPGASVRKDVQVFFNTDDEGRYLCGIMAVFVDSSAADDFEKTIGHPFYSRVTRTAFIGDDCAYIIDSVGRLFDHPQENHHE